VRRESESNRRVTTIALRVALAVLLWPILLGSQSDCVAQHAAEYDYQSLALTSVLSSATEAAKLPDVPSRVNLLVRAAKTLPPTHQDEAIRFLDLALQSLKEWLSQEKITWFQRNTAKSLLNEVLVVYSKLDPERTTGIQKDLQAEAEKSTTKSRSATDFSNQRELADQTATIAATLIGTDDDKASALIIQSLQTGIVSRVVFDIVQQQVESGRRTSLDKIEHAMGQVIAQGVTLEPFSLAYSASIVQADKEMSPQVRSAFLSFFLRSLETWSNLVKEPGISPSYISMSFTMYVLNVRPIIVQFSPERVLSFDLTLNQVAPLVPETTRARLQAFQPEKFTDSRDRLNDILKDSNAERRDLRLVGLISQIIRKEYEEPQKDLDLVAEAISGFADSDTKSAYTDFLTIVRINAFSKQQKFIEAQRLAGSISSVETRAWALLALSALALKADRVLGFALMSNALESLDKASPSPHKVELALQATAMLTKQEPARAFDALSAASKYANSSPTRVDPATKPAVAFGLEATIGEAHTRLGIFPESLAELQIDSSMSTLGAADWFRANQIVDGIRDTALRLQLKLQFAGAVLGQPKPRKATPVKGSVKN
jgi:hypothetical protein